MEDKFEILVQGLLDKGYGTIQGFLDREHVSSLRRSLTERHEKGEMKKAGIGNKFAYQQNVEVRGDRIFWLEKDDATEAEIKFLDIVDSFMAYLNATCYEGLGSHEFHYALYDKGSLYRRHLDRFRTDSGRKYSLVTYLNDDWVPDDGGQLILYFEGGNVELLPEGGRTVFFKSDEVEHEVMPSNRHRMSIAGWLKRH